MIAPSPQPKSPPPSSALQNPFIQKSYLEDRNPRGSLESRSNQLTDDPRNTRRKRPGGAPESDSRPAVAARSHDRPAAHPRLLRPAPGLSGQAVPGGPGDAGTSSERPPDRDRRRPADRRYRRQRRIELIVLAPHFFTTPCDLP